MFNGFIQERASSGNFPPSPPPSPVQVGRTLYVSSKGNDTTAVREDLVYHFLTLDAALNVAQTGDVIIVHPGTYAVTHASGLCVAAIGIYCYPGVVLSGTVFNGFAFNFTLLGSCTITTSVAQVFSGLANGISVFLQGHRFTMTAGAVMTKGCSLTFDIFDRFQINNTTGLYAFKIDNDETQTWQFQVKINVRTDFIMISNGFTADVVFLIRKLTTLSSVIVNANRIAVQGYKSNIQIIGTKEVQFDWTVTLNSYITGTVRLNYEAVVQVEDNYQPAEPVSSEFGVFINGTIEQKSNSGQLNTQAIKLIGGRLIVKGNILAEEPERAVSLQQNAVNEPSLLFLNDGYGVNFNGDDLINYLDNLCLVVLKNYKIKANQFAVNSDVAGSGFQVLSAFSTVPENVANVTNGIPGTSLIVEPTIQFETV